MIEYFDTDTAGERLLKAGLKKEKAETWLKRHQSMRFSGAPEDFEKAAADAGELCREARSLLKTMPLKSARDETQAHAGEILVRLMSGTCLRFTNAFRAELYERASSRRGDNPRLDQLAEEASLLCPGLYPSQEELLAEQTQMLRDKDGLELHQGVLFSQWFAEQRIGRELIRNMLRPTVRAVDSLAELMRKGSLDLEYARIVIEGEVGAVYMSNPKYLNAEDENTLEPTETAVDLALLHPGVRVGVLRGDQVDHPKYAGRRLFSSGINLTRLYHGRQSYLYYLTRELGLVNKLFRGLHGPGNEEDGLEHGIEKPWIAVVDGFAIGGGCQLLLVMDYVLAESGAFLNLPARREGIIPGCANLRLPRFVGDRLAYEAILFDRRFPVDAPESRGLVNEVCATDEMQQRLQAVTARVTGSGLVSASGNRKALRAVTEPLELFRAYMAQYAYEQAFCHLSPQLVKNLETNWQAKQRSKKKN